MTDTIGPIEAAQDAFRRQDRARARDSFDAARQAGLLDADSLFALAEAAWWLGEMDESPAAFEQAYRRYLQAGRPLRAAMAATSTAPSPMRDGCRRSAAASTIRTWLRSVCSARAGRGSGRARPARWPGSALAQRSPEA